MLEKTSVLWRVVALWCLVAVGVARVSAVEVREIIVTNNLTLERGATLNARLIVRASHIIIEGNGAALLGPGNAADLKSMEQAGIGVALEGNVNVTLRNLKVRGFATGLSARDCQQLSIEKCDFSDNYDNPKQGWGELPPRGGIYFERVRQSVVRGNKASRVWDALDLVESDDNLVEDNDFSHCSNTCAKLWRAGRNRFLRNNLSYGIRIDRAAGEVHARDSTGVLIESGSDDNYWFQNDVTQGGDGIFVRVGNWVSRGNVFVENDTSYANNNCFESLCPGNTYIRNKANHGSYGFWIGGSDQTVLIGNEAAFNGMTNGNHQAPEAGFGSGGVVVIGDLLHIIMSGNWFHDNNGGGIVFRGQPRTKSGRWVHHWIIQQNRLEGNRWGIWGQLGDTIWMANNVFSNNANENYLADLTRLSQIADDFSVEAAPRAEWLGPSRAMMGQAVQFDARGSRDLAGRELHFNWQAGEFSGDGPLFKPVFAKPGVYRLGLTVDNGVLADLAWCDLLVTDEVKDEIGTEGQAGLWGYAVEGNDGHGTMSFEDDLDAVAGKTSLRFRIDPKLGAATAIFPRGRDADWDFTGKTRVRFWLQFENPNQEGFQNPGPVLILYSKDGPIKIQPDKDHNLLNEVKLIGNKGRHTWMLFEVPLAGGEGWERKDSGNADLHHIAGLGLAFASGGNDPITIWLDGLAAE